jgi:hypothetical protein
MMVSLSEVQTKVRDAAFGAGASYGQAEDAGTGARRLAAWRLPWCEPLLVAFEQFTEGRCAASIDGDRPLCGPLVAPSLVDLFAAGDCDAGFSGRLIAPVFAIPAVCEAGLAGGVGIAATPGAHEIIAGPDSICVRTGDERELDLDLDLDLDFDAAVITFPVLVEADVSVVVPFADLNETALATAVSGVSVSDASWAALMGFVRRTYVPASEHSRLSGAGAGLIDSD